MIRRLARGMSRLRAGGETELTWTLPASYSWLRAALDGRDAPAAGRSTAS